MRSSWKNQNFLKKREVIFPLFFLFINMFLFLNMFYAQSLFAAPRPNMQSGMQQTRGSEFNCSDALQETKDTVSNLRYLVNNHEHEIREFDEKLKSLDAIIEGLRDEHSDAAKSHKEQIKNSSLTTEGKISALESICNGLILDLRQFKTCVNDSSAALNKALQKIAELEKADELQNQNIGHLQSAMRSLMEALQGKASPKASNDVTDSSSDNTYRIKAGDSLEKIARANQTTIQVLKDLNNLTSDKIVVGKVIRLPEKKAE